MRATRSISVTTCRTRRRSTSPRASRRSRAASSVGGVDLAQRRRRRAAPRPRSHVRAAPAVLAAGEGVLGAGVDDEQREPGAARSRAPADGRRRGCRAGSRRPRGSAATRPGPCRRWARRRRRSRRARRPRRARPARRRRSEAEPEQVVAAPPRRRTPAPPRTTGPTRRGRGRRRGRRSPGSGRRRLGASAHGTPPTYAAQPVGTSGPTSAERDLDRPGGLLARERTRDHAVGARASATYVAVRQRQRQAQPAVVVDVLTDEVDPARRRPHPVRLPPELRGERGGDLLEGLGGVRSVRPSDAVAVRRAAAHRAVALLGGSPAGPRRAGPGRRRGCSPWQDVTHVHPGRRGPSRARSRADDAAACRGGPRGQPPARRPRLLSGMQPTADSLHLGNLLGALTQWVALQEDHDAIYCVVDLHALTVNPDPAVLRDRTRRTAAQYLAAGVDPARSILFVQSHVARARRARVGARLPDRLRRGRPHDAVQGQVRQAGRRPARRWGCSPTPSSWPRTSCSTTRQVVPVGEDQRQHLELTRNLAQRLNTRFGPRPSSSPSRTSSSRSRRSSTCRTRRRR